MHIVLLFHNVFQRHKKSFLIIKMKLRHCITLKKPLRKIISLYIIVTVSCGTYLGIIQNMKRKFISNAANTWKNHTLDTHFVSCSCFFSNFLVLSDFLIVAETKMLTKMIIKITQQKKLCSIISRCKCYNTNVTRIEMTFAQDQFNFLLNIK